MSALDRCICAAIGGREDMCTIPSPMRGHMFYDVGQQAQHSAHDVYCAMMVMSAQCVQICGFCSTSQRHRSTYAPLMVAGTRTWVQRNNPYGNCVAKSFAQSPRNDRAPAKQTPFFFLTWSTITHTSAALPAVPGVRFHTCYHQTSSMCG